MTFRRAITIDNGGSEARVLPLGSTVDTGLKLTENEYYSIAEADFRVRESDDELGICRIVKAPKEEYIGIIGQGIVGGLYRGKALYMDSVKTKSVNYYRQFIYNVARDAATVSICQGKLPVLNRFTEPYVYDYTIGTCIPVKEHAGTDDCVNILKEALAGEYEVVFPLVSDDVVRFIIKKEQIGVVPEGGVAIVGLRNSLGDTDVSLVFDMGQVTCDLSLYKGTKLLGKVVTAIYAGNALNANITSALEDEGYFVKEDEITDVITTGEVKVNAGVRSVAEIVTEQKKMFISNYILKEVRKLLTLNAVDSRQIVNVIPIGAPMGKNHVTGSLCEMIVRACGLEGATIKYMSDNLRYVNVEQTAKLTTKLYSRVIAR